MTHPMTTRERETAVMEILKDHGTATVIFITKQLGIPVHLIHYIVRAMRKKERIHISHWERPPWSNGDELYVAAFAAGKGIDAHAPVYGGLDFHSTSHLQDFYVHWTKVREPEEIEA